eukprot:CAMPEP_0169070338 /NCGR_PEP_ID=MMETSP1015-20121227/5061_1 /TAXON_ID=342587 /ORGANISM="Karlodinium micrum, Strain CCMP2283" /LENGTH=579 /DNA_ID=CAMNT_0009129327 /DNA_START=116 /DNA_END=1855 /DNA_ORIENTATION=+
MGVLGKLAFWRKSKVSLVEAFEIPSDEVVADTIKETENSSAIATPTAESRREDSQVALLQEQLSPEPSPKSPAEKAQVIASTPISQKSASKKSAADDFALLEAELLDEVPEPLPGPTLTLEQSFPLGRAASPSDEEVDFDVPLEQVYASVTQAFGPMIGSSLQSPKWDKRAQALKAVGTMLRGLDLQGMAPPGSTGVLGKGLRLRDRVCCWRSCCQLLHHVMRDKVMPVRLASHDLFHDAFANAEGLVTQEECDRALKVLILHVIEKLGDSNVRLHESARKCVYFCAERRGLLGLEIVLGLLQARLSSSGKGGERQKVYNGVLDAVNFLLNRFPGRRADVPVVANEIEDVDEAVDGSSARKSSWTQHDIAPFIDAGMDDSLGPRVRITVVALAVTVYQTFGMEAMEPVLAGLRPAKQAVLRQKFQETEENDSEDFGRNSRCGTTASTMATPSDVTRADGFGLSACKVGKCSKFAPLPGALVDPDEDLMDGILEETGMVFGGASIINEAFGHDSRCLRPVPGMNSRSVLEDDLEEEHRILEEELLRLDMDLTEIDEQEAAFGDFPRGGNAYRSEFSMEVC